MDKLNNACAVIDMQGYCFEKKFFPRELAICSDKIEISIEIDCGLKENSFKNIHMFNDYKFQKYLIHGIPLESIRGNIGLKVHDMRQVEVLIKKLYEKIKSADKFLFACKNQQVARLLERLDIPFFNLEKTIVENEICPKLETFDETIGGGQVWFCPLHTCLPNQESSRKKLRCSLRKSRYIWNWLSTKIEVNSLLENIASFEE